MQTAMESTAVAALPLSHSQLSGGGVGGVGGNSNGSSSASSGYGSATTTPTTPLSNHYDAGTVAASTTSMAATIATVAPFYSEALSQQLPPPHQQPTAAHQQSHYYHQNYSYSNAMPLDYNAAYNAYTSSGMLASGYQTAPGARYEKLATANKYVAQPLQPLQSLYKFTTNSSDNAGGVGGTGGIGSNTSSANTSNNNPNVSAASYSNLSYDAAAAYKMTVKTTPDCGSVQPIAGTMGSYAAGYPGSYLTQPTQQPQAQSNQKSQFSQMDANYAAIKPSTRYQSMAPIYGSSGTGSSSNNNSLCSSNNAYYPGLGFDSSISGPSPLFSSEDPYRKTSSNSCHWGMDYAASCRTLPPVPQAMPSNATAYHGHPAGGELYYGAKYDKYGTPPYGSPYQPPNVSQPFATRNMWAGDPGTLSMQPYPNPTSATGAASARQSCCTQPYGQQSCYYPRSNGYPAVPPNYTSNAPPPAQYIGGGTTKPHNDYVPHMTAPAKLKHPTDLYVAHAPPPPPYDTQAAAATQLAYPGYPGAGSSNGSQRYMPAPTNQHQLGLGMDAATAYYNDLNSMQPMLDSYALQPMQAQQSLQSHRQPTYLSSGKPNSLLEYRKRPSLPPHSHITNTNSNSNCYITQSSAPLSNLEAHVDSYGGYGATTAIHYGAQSTGKPSSSSNNIRDFLSSWNDDEEEQTTVVTQESDIQPVAIVAPVASSNFMYETLAPVGPVATAVMDQSAELSQCQPMNLPDIIIDIEKSNGNGNLTHVSANTEDSFGSFDVEKELDDLRFKRNGFEPIGSIEERPTDALADILNAPGNDTDSLPLPETLTMPLPLLSASEEAAAPLQETSIISDSQLPQVELDNNTSNSNESSFEKEYETFIHKIGGSGSETETNAQDGSEYREHAKKFKFYKRKRKITESNGEVPADQQQHRQELAPTGEKQAKEAVENGNTIAMSAPALARANRKLCARRRRNHIKMLKILEFESPKIKHGFYFKALKALRRRFALDKTRQKRTLLMRRQLEVRKERHLPLIKRQSAKQYKQQLYNPPTLKGLSVSVMNSQAFRTSLMGVVDGSSPIERADALPMRTETVIKTARSAQESSRYERELERGKTEPMNATKPMKTEEARIELDDARNALPICELQEQDSLDSVELLASFKGFDDIENTHLSPRASLQVEADNAPSSKPKKEEASNKTTAHQLAEQHSKQQQIQEWLQKSMANGELIASQQDPPQVPVPVPTIAISSTSSSSSSSSTSTTSASTSSSSSNSSSTDDNDASSSCSEGSNASSSSSSSSNGKSSSSCSGEESEFNELAALKKELSQHPHASSPIEPPVEQATVIEAADEVDAVKAVSNRDIAKLKKILESDGEEAGEHPNATVPKLSDLSKIALNSSLKTSELVIKTHEDNAQKLEHAVEVEQSEQPDNLVQRELSVEEALAEMYQQIGVVSDPEDYVDDNNDDAAKDAEAAGADVLLINLAEIFDNNSSDLYVVQCDMNENILGVVATDEEQAVSNEDQVNTLQLIELLADAEPEIDAFPRAETPELGQFVTTPIIHHEEIVPDNYKEFERREFLKYLHAKYVQGHISKYYHAQRVLKKYRRRLCEHQRRRQQPKQSTNDL
ncbi:uncharacterized protein LOC115631248 [Scaptodrosophila lebanonensis]|uniref:Uncharacterized protein LOC115631248 n=1 Tax=Drosophila lebanonensis TaxID=7225 RepID=A0A6J2U8F3_DROLE|nr:uncharacterized protein LOC115631248 [Scaptodrosophila lebanonensis]